MGFLECLFPQNVLTILDHNTLLAHVLSSQGLLGWRLISEVSTVQATRTVTNRSELDQEPDS